MLSVVQQQEIYGLFTKSQLPIIGCVKIQNTNMFPVENLILETGYEDA